MDANMRTDGKARGRVMTGRPRLGPLAAALALACAGGGAAAQNLPTGFDLVNGSVTPSTPDPNTLALVQGSSKAIVQWNAFDIANGYQVQITQPNASSILLNRVVGTGGPSQIFGSLNANGRVFLINPQGILFGATAQVNVGGLVASSLSISDADFLSDTYVFNRVGLPEPLVINRGTLTAADGGTLALLGNEILNEGRMTANGGTIGLASADRVTLDFQGDGLTMFQVSNPTSPTSVRGVTQGSAGVLQADGGRVMVLAEPTAMPSLVVNLSGTIRARSLTSRRGEIVLDAGMAAGAAGNVELSNATLDTRGIAGGPQNGLIDIRGDDITLSATTIQAAGDLRLWATGSIAGDPGTTIDATGGGPLNVAMLANVNASGTPMHAGSGQVLFGGAMRTEGGSFEALGSWERSACSICLVGATIDTRVGQSDAGAGGAVTLTGVGTGVSSPVGSGVHFDDAQIRASTGNVRITGRGAGDEYGVQMVGTSTVQTTTGRIEVTGQGGGQGAGIELDSAASIAASDGAVVLRASSEAGQALVLDGTVSAGRWLNLRPGEVSAQGVAADAAGDIFVSNSGATGFVVSSAMLGQLSTPELILGSNTHAGNIVVETAVNRTGSHLSLQNSGSSDIDIRAPLSAQRVTLAAGRDVIQQPTGAVVTTPELIVTAGRNVTLAASTGNAVGRLSALSGGTLDFVNSGTLVVGAGTGTGVDAAAQSLQSLPVNGVTAGQVRVMTLADDLVVQAPVRAAGDADLVAARLFHNQAGAGGVSAGGRWRIWADDWVGETRGGLAGSGTYPNLYGRSYANSSTSSLPNAGNAFIYTRQPQLVARIDDLWRPYGMNNPRLTYALLGLILGDSGAGVTGLMSTPAQPDSPLGDYAITGTFQSVEGYQIQVVPGTLSVVPYRPPPPADLVRQPTESYLYDHNIITLAMCQANGNVSGPEDEQGGDALGREWTRVRSRPQLSSCVVTEEQNGCNSF